MLLPANRHVSLCIPSLPRLSETLLRMSATCLIGSIHQVNQTIAEIDLSPNPLVNSLAFFTASQNQDGSSEDLEEGTPCLSSLFFCPGSRSDLSDADSLRPLSPSLGHPAQPLLPCLLYTRP
ncbi:hypothetical protein MC885_012916 [Smutsia gigantea]|nr:hypothetical protein MC885_012916 [Smutsia gigantea]